MSKHLTANVAPVDVLIQNKKFQIIPKIEQVRIPSYTGPAKYLKKGCTYTRQFSKSGIEEMSEVLKKKSMHLKKNMSCGNQKVDPGEACDEGSEGGPCCEKNCSLKDDAVCSELSQC